MSPDRGQENISAMMQTSSVQRSKESHDSGYGSSAVSDTSAPSQVWVQEPTHFWDARQETNSPRSHNDSTPKWTAAMDGTAYQKHTTASVRSGSSAENSRRDSAISASSQHGRRPKASRTMSKQSLKSDEGTLNKTKSCSSKHRPRAQRVNTTGSHSVPAQSLDDARAFHARSCQIFAAAARPSTSYAVPSTSYSSRPHQSIHRSPSFQSPSPSSQYTELRPYAARSLTEPAKTQAVEDQQNSYDNYVPATVMHWTSDDVRRQEYAQIDKSNTGVRGLLRKVLPKWVTKGQPKFYEGKDDESDAGSVRRIRMDLPVDQPVRKTGGKGLRSMGA